MSILFLSPEDFYIGNSEDGPVLFNRLRGMSLILFYSRDCVKCEQFIPKFKQCPGSIYGCAFAMANVDLQQQRLVEMSHATVMKITYTPLIMLYMNGKPVMAYRGPRDPQAIAEFIYDYTSKLQNRQNFIEKRTCKMPEKDSKVPAYCVGVPYDGTDDVCYISFGKAYT